MRNMLLVCLVGMMLSPSCRGSKADVVSELPPAETRPAGSAPELPRIMVEIPPAAIPAPTRVLKQGEDLQKAIDDARPGDVIALTPRAIFKGPITLPEKSGSGWITIRSVANNLKAGTRVSPEDARMMPVIESDTRSAIVAARGAHHYQFIGIEIRPAQGTFLYNLIELGFGETSLDDIPHHFVFERCYIHGDPTAGGRRGIALNSRHTAVFDSHVSDFKERGADSQALAGWNGPGPFLIVNNYLEGAGENLIFGGGDPSIKNLVPSDIAVQRNHFAKPLAWMNNAQSHWAVKNLFELKNARRVLVEDNVFENNWLDAQSGFAILFTPRNQDGGAPWSGVQDVTFRRNVIRHSGSAVNIMGRDDNYPSEQTQRIAIRDNLFVDIDGAKWGGSGRLFQILGGTADVTIEHNTALQSGDVITADGEPNIGFVYRHNLTSHNEYGVGGTGTYGNPMRTLTTFFPGIDFSGNVLIGGEAPYYPPNNFFPASIADVKFVDAVAGNYQLADDSPFKSAATDGKDIGADLGTSEAHPKKRPAR